MTQLHFKIIEQDTIAMALLTKIYPPLNCLLISLWVVFSSANANASAIDIADSGNNDAKLVTAESSDMLIPSIPNSDGNSYTKLTSFTVDRPLKIINSTGTHSSLKSAPAKLIIIDATSADLRNSIEIVGETADLLIFVNSNTANLSCTNCSFANIGRATLATAGVAFDSAFNPGNLTPTTANLQINGLSTDGVASVELIGNKVYLNGNINTQARGSRLSDGSYQLNSAGGLIIGAGGVNVFSGLVIAYPTLSVVGSDANSSLEFTNLARISSQAVHIATAKPFRLLGTVTTKSDATTAINYRGKLSAVEESINIYSFGSGGTLSIEGALYSDKLVDLRSASDVTLSGVINAAGLIAFAGEEKKLMHGASGSLILPGRAAKWLVSRADNTDMVGLAECSEKPLKANGLIDEANAYLCLSAFLSGGSVENNGSIKGRNVLVAAIGDVQNRYSGRIVADNIQLSSQKGFIRNGSQYPFRPIADAPKFLAPIDPNNIPLGTVTINDTLFLSAQKDAQKVDTSAFIIGKNVILSASGNIENINPYLELTTDTELWRNGVVFSPVESARVQMIAEDNLKIESDSYILNSSAYMGVSKPGGVFYASAPSIANQRYTAQAVVQPFNRDASSVNNKGLEAALMVYSPQGAIYSFAELQFQLGTLGSFVNNSSYFEVLNDAKIGSPSDPVAVEGEKIPPETPRSKIINIGLNVNSVVNTSVNTQFVTCVAAITAQDEATNRNEYGKCKTLYGSIVTLAPGTQIEAEQGTLFNVKGTYDSTSHMQVTNHNVMAKLKDDVIANYIQAQPKVGSGTKRHPTVADWTISYSYTMKTLLSADGASLITQATITEIDRSNCHSEGPDRFCQAGIPDSDVNQMTTVQNIAQLLEETFKKMKADLIELINALKKLL